MKTIWKFELEITEYQHIKIPIDADIIHVGVQKNVPCLWALVDSDKDLKSRYFRMYGTGHEINFKDKRLIHLGSVIMLGDNLVFHIFEQLL